MNHFLSMLVLMAVVFLDFGCMHSQRAANLPPPVDPPQMEDPFDPDRPPTAKTVYLMADILSAQGRDAQAEQLYKRIQTEYPDF